MIQSQLLLLRLSIVFALFVSRPFFYFLFFPISHVTYLPQRPVRTLQSPNLATALPIHSRLIQPQPRTAVASTSTNQPTTRQTIGTSRTTYLNTQRTTISDPGSQSDLNHSRRSAEIVVNCCSGLSFHLFWLISPFSQPNFISRAQPVQIPVFCFLLLLLVSFSYV